MAQTHIGGHRDRRVLYAPTLGCLNQPTERAHFLGYLLFALKPVRASIMTNIDRPKNRAINTTLQAELLDTPSKPIPVDTVAVGCILCTRTRAGDSPHSSER